jgi:hypothetical protein
VLAAAGLVIATAAPGSARWSVHNDLPTVSEVNPPPGQPEGRICADQLRGRTGWIGQVAEGQDPATFEIPTEASTSVDYQLLRAESGPSPTVVKEFTTPSRTKVTPPIFAEIGDRIYVFTTARFSEQLFGVAPGDELWLVPKPAPDDPNPPAPASLTAVGCGDTGFMTEWEADLNWCRSEQLLVGDVNGDARADLVCHAPTSGYKWVALATVHGTFTGTSWEGNLRWCRSPAQLRLGDVNGDGRDDMICHAPSSGYKWVALARAGGRFVGTDWRADLHFCVAPAQLQVGDVNGDGRDDLVCHRPATGYKRVALAKAGGRFTGTDWQANLRWCLAPAQLHVGDVNGNGRDDLVCHTPASGYKRVALAKAGGRFTGTDWQANLRYCLAPSQLRIADVDADGRDDLVCHAPATGRTWVALARAGGRFDGTDWQRNMGWCPSPGKGRFTADLDGDGRDDLLCHEPATGYKWARYSDL